MITPFMKWLGVSVSSLAFRPSVDTAAATPVVSPDSFQSSSVSETPSSRALLDLDRQTESQVSQSLLSRASVWNFRRLSLVRTEDLELDPVQQLFYVASLGDIFAAIPGAGAKKSSSDLEKILRKMGYDAENLAFAKNYVKERSRLVVERLNLRTREDRCRLALEFLEIALHARQEVGVCLFLARRIASLAGLDWAGLLKERRDRMSDYERALIASVREEGGAVPFDHFYDLAMFHPAAGTYTGQTANHLISADLVAQPDGFFTTAATDPVLAKSMTAYARGVWEKLGRPTNFDLVEMGAGMGSLAEAIMASIDALPSDDPFRSAAHYTIVEKSPALARLQEEKLGRFGAKAQVLRRSAIVGALPRVAAGLFFSNELVDMFPPRKIVNAGGRLQEAYIAYRGGLFQEVAGPLREETARYLADRDIRLTPGETFYVQLDIGRWVSALAEALGAGGVVTIDYGNRRAKLRKYRHEFGHSMFRGFLQRTDPKTGFGLVALQTYKDSPTGVARPKDLTVDVDFDAIEEAANATGCLEASGFLSQREFYERYSREQTKEDGFHGFCVSLLAKTPA